MVAALDASDVTARINKRYDDLFWLDSAGRKRLYACSVCDEIVETKSTLKAITLDSLLHVKNKKLLRWDDMPDMRRKQELESYYRFPQENRDQLGGNANQLDELCLSPRGCVHKLKNTSYKWGVSSCSTCYNAFQAHYRPHHAIINRNYVGGAPEVLTRLNDVELALLTPVTHHGYCFTFVGGQQKLLKGTLTFMRVEKRSIANSVATLQSMGFTEHLLVIFSGQMTHHQKSRVIEKTTIRTHHVIEALDWLHANHVDWMDVDINNMRDELKKQKVTVVDHSEEVSSEDSNVEQNEAFTCFYPDGAVTPEKGGFDEPGAFKQYVESMSKDGYDIQFRMDLEKEFVRGNDSDVLVSAGLLQFPYGIGGFDEARINSDNGECIGTDIQDYLIHLSNLSQTVFHTAMFQLVMYSILSKSRLLKRSRLKLKSQADAESMATGLTPQDLHHTIKMRRNGNRFAGTRATRTLLDAVETCAQSLPHTNEASRRAKATGEAMQHHFGMGSIFLTVTFDDENSLVMQALSGIEIDDNTDVNDLSADELSARAKARQKLRIKYPGIAAVHYEVLLKILVEEVCGWDMARNCATSKEGAFGSVEAFQLSTEEQGRKTLHGHMIIWLKGYRDLYKKLFWGSKEEKKKAERAIVNFYDAISDTSLFPTIANSVKCVFDHEGCTASKSERDVPVTVSDQDLRYLRHKYGYKAVEGKILSCPNCDKIWTYEDMIGDLMAHTFEDNGFTRAAKRSRIGDQIPRHRMSAELLCYQANDLPPSPPVSCINAFCNSHLSCHVNGCFKCSKKRKRGHVCGPKCECRFRLPDLPRSTARIRTLDEGVDWYNWNGDCVKQPIVQVQPRRGKYDLFQNVSATAVSQSKFTCNSNISLISIGPLGQYTHKYQKKENNKEETAEYAEVESEVKKMEGRKHEDDKSEAVRKILRASFAHNKTNVISPAFGNYLIRHNSRFYESHEFKFCPLKDVIKVHEKKSVDCCVNWSDGTTYFENQALHYLCRPFELIDVPLIKFTEDYEVATVPDDKKKRKASKKSNKNKSKNVPDVIPFMPNTGYFKHPSVIKKGNRIGKCYQGVKQRDDPVLAKISQWQFPDTAEFNADICTCHVSQMNKSMELYAQLVLTLFMPHRSAQDLKINDGGLFPYVRKFQEVHFMETHGHPKVVFTDRNTNLLQNIQDCRKNSLRYTIPADELADITEPFDCNGNVDASELPERQEQDEDAPCTDYETLLDVLGDDDVDPTDKDPTELAKRLHDFTFKSIRKRGVLDCGMIDDVPVPTVEPEDISNFVEWGVTSTSSPSTTDKEYPEDRIRKPIEHLTQLVITKRSPAIKKTLWEDKTVVVSEANGSVASILEWSKAACGNDRKQRRAFEVIISAFLLTFYHDAEVLDKTAPTSDIATSVRFYSTKKKLKKLLSLKKTDQLICLLHGPGGSGKSTVINAVRAYAKEFCDLMHHKYTSRTIVVTAMSGVAATLLHGETTHSVLGLNKKISSLKKECDEFHDTRLVIIDEISFAGADNLIRTSVHLDHLMQESFKHFGGVNMVFAGDYSQMEPVKDAVIYDDEPLPEFHYSLNCFIELDGMWRFKDDPEWGRLLLRFRRGIATVEDIDLINNSCNIEHKPPPKGIQVATYTNKDRDAVNCSIFERYIEANAPADESKLFHGAMVILMDSLEAYNSKKVYVPVTSNAVKRHFYERCGESSLDMERGRCDSILKLYPGCPMMLTKNADVVRGEANGSRVRCKSVSIKPGEQAIPLKLKCGTYIKAFYACQVNHITVDHEQEDITPKQFNVKSQTCSFKTTLDVGYDSIVTRMRGTQFPIVSNTCTTGHKLQGCSIDNILVNHFHYSRNWAYVVLSRVRSMKGLYLRDLLATDLSAYAVSENMLEMLDEFKKNCGVTYLTEDEYNQLL